MKKIIFFLTGFLCALTFSGAQEKPEPFQSTVANSPVSFEYHAKKISGNSYELYISAFIQPGWHLYSQHQPEDAIAIPTAIKFYKNASFLLNGGTKEVGNLEKDSIAALGISSLQYEGQVDFVQQVRLKALSPLRIIGSITYQVCKDNECLQPVTKEFTIRIPSSDSLKK